MRLLITSGATREAIDGVRFISNFSTGRTGAELADLFSEAGFEVTYLRGEGAIEPVSRCEIVGFGDFVSLDAALRRELGRGDYFAVIHLAAVSDYSVKEIVVGSGAGSGAQSRSFSPRELAKIDSHEAGDELKLVLKRNFKIVDRLKSYGARRVIAFKLTNAADREAGRRAAARVASSGAVDGVVHNDLAQIREEMKDGLGVHRFEFFGVRNGALHEGLPCSGTDELAAAMLKWFSEGGSV